MTYRVVITAAARHDLRSIPRPIAVKIGEEIVSLAGETEPKKHLKRLKGASNPPFYSLRIGDYRAILSIIDDLLVIHVIAVGHRSKVYRRF
ncbi:type II toxin-antitoxin system RelE/ParE family toxin [Methanoculleus sp. Wushi-C6]|uniref:Type II toxin-antitoxin system RelE/ParE family toxin n=1 Tax=Methanoculleus caldifontis TaxID=2651577 RepID=A0ABU3WXX0_9EURY|nr:type II toxin-antitoxin system RelE/ParE family toxin [Methanoculleus sp. Wushi-C6]MDV2480653.1 type II toxin-antitoxin system RelE/ParE family toxin [Methanoculleus sp. Wushi-C6]